MAKTKLSDEELEELIQRAENFMIDSFTDHRNKIPRVIGEGMVRHNLQTRDYVKELATNRMHKPGLELAAILHNIERAFRKNERFAEHDELSHEKKSAEIAGQWLEEQDVPKKLAKKVKRLIKLHEKGGTKEAQALVEADCLSFLENTLPIWFEAGLWMGHSKEELIEMSHKKVEEEWNRIETEEGKEIAKEYYDKWKEWLEQKEESISGN